MTQTEIGMTAEIAPIQASIPEHKPTVINTELFRAFLNFGTIIADEQTLRFTGDTVSLRSKNKGNTGMCIIESKIPFGFTGEIGMNLSQLASALPKTETVTITIGKKMTIESTDYRANLLTSPTSDPNLVITKLKKDYAGEGGFVVGAKDFADKAAAMKSAFQKGEYFLSIISNEKTPEEVIISTDDTLIGDVKYRVTTGGGKPETWTRSYDYELILPILKIASQFSQEAKISWLIMSQGTDSFAVLVLSGSTPDGMISYSYALAPRVIQKGAP